MTVSNKGLWIPASIMNDERLTLIDACVLAEIHLLANNPIGCTASNFSIAKQCKCSEASVKRAIKSLLEYGLISDVGTRKNRIFRVNLQTNNDCQIKATINIESPSSNDFANFLEGQNDTYSAQNDTYSAHSDLEGHSDLAGQNDTYSAQKRTYSAHSDPQENNINKNNKKKEIYKKESRFENQEVNRLFDEFLETREKIKKGINTDYAIGLLVKKLNLVDDQTKIAMLEQSIENGYRGLFEVKDQKQSNYNSNYKPKFTADEMNVNDDDEEMARRKYLEELKRSLNEDTNV